VSSDVWDARIDLCVDKESNAYWIMLRLRNNSQDEKKHMSVLMPKAALAEALERASRLEEKGLRERSEQPTELLETKGD